MSSRDLTEGSVRGHLVRLGAPMAIGIVAAMSVALIDTYFLGLLGTAELAAISFTFPVVFAITSLSIGLGAGTASVVSREIGGGDLDRVKRTATDSLVLAVIIVAIVAFVGWLTVEPLFQLLGADPDVLELTVAYMRIWYIGMPFLVVPMVANNIIRANGDAIVPSAIMVAVSVINAALDPLLIFGWGPVPAMGIEGAAWASVIARAATMVVALSVVVFREKLVDLTVPAWTVLVESWRRILSVGIPAALGNAVNPVGIAVVTAIVATYGTEAVAGFGVATRVEAFASIPMLALSAAIGPIAGQNWGKGHRDRVLSAVRQCFVFCAFWSLGAAALMFLFADTIAGVFSSDDAVVAGAGRYLAIVPISLGGYGIVTIAAGAYNALGKPLTGLAYYLVRTAVLYVPLAWIASLLAPTEGVFIAIAASNVIAGALVAWHALHWLGGAEQKDCTPAAASIPAE